MLVLVSCYYCHYSVYHADLCCVGLCEGLSPSADCDALESVDCAVNLSFLSV